ncbi:hypothetical protein BKA62DRAFT_677827 [Auriculariales sp. MPI-PUGE-AT-0066]|nr:hypothetical protein BKA62DRAFT_677827 [Auriculariales sp. MPI-PUGE-AT-0066]
MSAAYEAKGANHQREALFWPRKMRTTGSLFHVPAPYAHLFARQWLQGFLVSVVPRSRIPYSKTTASRLVIESFWSEDIRLRKIFVKKDSSSLHTSKVLLLYSIGTALMSNHYHLPQNAPQRYRAPGLSSSAFGPSFSPVSPINFLRSLTPDEVSQCDGLSLPESHPCQEPASPGTPSSMYNISTTSSPLSFSSSSSLLLSPAPSVSLAATPGLSAAGEPTRFAYTRVDSQWQCPDQDCRRLFDTPNGVTSHVSSQHKSMVGRSYARVSGDGSTFRCPYERCCFSSPSSGYMSQHVSWHPEGSWCKLCQTVQNPESKRHICKGVARVG